LRTEQPLDVHPAQRGSINSMPELLRPNVAHQVSGRIGMAVHMAVKTGDPTAGPLAAPVFGLIELLLRERGDQHP
jgi:hypothetical protein